MSIKKFMCLNVIVLGLSGVACKQGGHQPAATAGTQKSEAVQHVVASTPKKVSCPGGQQLRMVMRDDRTVEFDCSGGVRPVVAEAPVAAKK